MLYGVGSSSLVLADNLEGSGWEMEGRLKREGTYVYLWLIHVDVWQKPTQYCNYPSIKNKFRKRLEKEKAHLPAVTG